MTLYFFLSWPILISCSFISDNLVMDQSGESCYFEPCPASQDGKSLSKSRAQRIRSIIKASKEVHRDGRHEYLERLLENDKEAFISCHRSCVSTYVSTEHLNRPSKRLTSRPINDDVPREKRSCRSETPTRFDFREHCLFCGQVCVMDVDPKNPNRWRRVVLCRTVCKVNRDAKTFLESIIETCNKRNDDQAQQVKLRVLGAVSDLHAADARYHKDCRDSFMPLRSVTFAAKASTSKQHTSIEEAFLSTVSDIEVDKSKIWNSVEVFELYLSHGGEECSRRSLVPKLVDYFGSDFLVLSGTGVANLLVFRSKASASLRLVQREDDADIDGLLEAVGRHIVSETKELNPDKTTYHAGIDLDLALDCVSPTLLGLLAKLSKKLNHTAPAAIIGNIVSSMINNCYTDMQIALGIVIGKKALIQDFFHFGVSCSYEEVLRYKDSAAAAAVRDVNLMGISTESNRLIQVVSDNFDANISSQNGLVSTHALAMLLTCAGVVRQCGLVCFRVSKQ